MIITTGQIYQGGRGRFKIVDVAGDTVKYVSKRCTQADWGTKLQYISVKKLTEALLTRMVRFVGAETYAVNTGCQHEFKNYVGLREMYSYCIKCDVKESQAV